MHVLHLPAIYNGLKHGRIVLTQDVEWEAEATKEVMTTIAELVGQLDRFSIQTSQSKDFSRDCHVLFFCFEISLRFPDRDL